jgi:hypothetical protein
LFDRLTIIHSKSICRSLLDTVWKGCPCAKNRPTPDGKDAWLNLDDEESANCVLKRYRVVGRGLELERWRWETVWN